MNSDDLGKLVLRVSLGVLILMHGIFKLSNGVDGISGMLASHGIPGFVAYLVLVGEVVAPILIIIGFFTRAGGAIIAINMVVAIVLAHGEQLGSLSRSGGWALELQGMFLFAAVAVMLMGAGRFSVGGVSGRYN